MPLRIYSATPCRNLLRRNPIKQNIPYIRYKRKLNKSLFSLIGIGNIISDMNDIKCEIMSEEERKNCVYRVGMLLK